MGAAGIVALISFISYLPKDAALSREMDPKDEFGEWNTQRKTNAILADLPERTDKLVEQAGIKVAEDEADRLPGRLVRRKAGPS